MIPLEEFLEVAPESLKNSDSPHRQMINRLSYEFEERKRYNIYIFSKNNIYTLYKNILNFIYLKIIMLIK